MPVEGLNVHRDLNWLCDPAGLTTLLLQLHISTLSARGYRPACTQPSPRQDQEGRKPRQKKPTSKKEDKDLLEVGAAGEMNDGKMIGFDRHHDSLGCLIQHFGAEAASEHPEHDGVIRRRLDNLRRGGLANGPEPERIGPYRVTGLLGHGGMTQVYGGVHPVIGKRVALKVLHPKLMGDERFRRRLLREAKAAAAVSHGNIAAVHEIGEAEGHVFIAMELVDDRLIEGEESHYRFLVAEHRSRGADTQFFIKISAATLQHGELLQYIGNCMKVTRLPGHALTFEIAEKHAAQHLKHAKSFVNTLREMHCKTALEHFGAGPNSFQLLKHLPVDFLKIDGSFIHNLASDSDNQAMVRSILATANSMNRQCIAEYVQDAHSLAVLWQNGIQFIQGNFLQEPSEALDYDFSSEIA